MSSTSEPDSNDLLQNLVEGTSGETGVAFFKALVHGMSDALRVEGAWVTEYLPDLDHLRSIAFRLNDGWVDHYEYELEDTPCGAAVKSGKLVFLPDQVLDAFPSENDLREFNAAGYIGAPLFDENGQQVLGHLGAFSVQPMPCTKRYQKVFELFASRAGAELRRLRLERELRARTDELEAIVQSAMDAILILDEERDIVKFNQAAERIFQSSGMEGEMLDRFLSVDGAEKLEPLFDTLAAESGKLSQLWIPGGFEVRLRSGEKFAAEGTLSRFSLAGKTYFTLILRNVSERIAAEEKIEQLSNQTDYLRQEVEKHFGEIVGNSPAMRKVVREIREVAGTDASVLVTGETGTGKELIARALHRASRRADRALIKVNCAAIPATLIESEFFGHEKGAFTGATVRREGRFSLADGGTLFLDEIGELPLDLQSKLLRVLQEGEFEPVGSSRTRKADVRVIAATNRDLRKEALEGRFREDLYYRLSVFPLHVPALRNRKSDIPLLAEEFLRRFCEREARRPVRLEPGDLDRLTAYSWPGNVRELANVLERALITAKDGRLNLERALPESEASAVEPSRKEMVPAQRILTAGEMLELEILNIRKALESAKGKVSGSGGAAELLGMRPSTLSSRIKALKISL